MLLQHSSGVLFRAPRAKASLFSSRRSRIPRDYEFRLRVVSSRYCETVPRDSRAASVEFRASSKLREGDSVSLVIAASLLDPCRFRREGAGNLHGRESRCRVTRSVLARASLTTDRRHGREYRDLSTATFLALRPFPVSYVHVNRTAHQKRPATDDYASTRRAWRLQARHHRYSWPRGALFTTQ